MSKILHTAADRARKLLEQNRDKLDRMSEELCLQEILDEKEIEAIIGPSPNRASANGHANIPHKTPVEPVRADLSAGSQ